MKITINIDCTPQEARTFFGLPDMEPLNEAMVAGIRERMEDFMKKTGPEEFMKQWMSGAMGANISGLESLQKMFWNAPGFGKSDQDK